MIYARHHCLRLHYAVHLALWIWGRSCINSSLHTLSPFAISLFSV